MNLKRIFTLFLSVVMIYLVVPETELRVSASVAAGQTVICVSPTGSADGRGTEKSPLDIYTAVEQALPGQTIFLMGSTYSLNKPLVIARGIDGTAGQRITLMGDPENRPVLNAGVVLAADYWYLQGFDVTNTADGVTGVLVSGNNNTLDQINTYGNGGTGIEICTYLPTDTKAEWPSGNLILNCSSYGNAGSGNLADGFAASLTVGDNNVFDGCIAHHNADDGFDISAAVETGPIGQVVIQNSVAYKNGYLLNNTPAGSGRGFKLGSGRISGYHILINSIAFDNKWAGISSGDVAEELYKASDFPPEERIAAREARGMKMGAHDAIILNSTAFNNERYNVQLDPYGDDSNSVVNTDYSVTGFLSFRTEYTDVRDRTSPRGRQDITKFYNTTNYYWNESKSISVNSVLNEVAAEWFESLTFSTITRNTDGTINMNDFLELTATAPSDTGARMSGTPSPVFQVEMPVDEEPKEPDIIFPSYTPTFDPSYTSYPPAPTYTTADTENYTSKTGITSTVTITDGGVEVNAGINKSGSVNSEATAAAVKKAAQIA
ncbi:MAG: right-handed parallel beta-helix repeat-containing protein, partial [Ruminococcus sp.]|nr:right-handed parallel beta-helix repeat-containing protein [Ruminococcus sp.]